MLLQEDIRLQYNCLLSTRGVQQISFLALKSSILTWTLEYLRYSTWRLSVFYIPTPCTCERSQLWKANDFLCRCHFGASSSALYRPRVQLSFQIQDLELSAQLNNLRQRIEKLSVEEPGAHWRACPRENDVHDHVTACQGLCEQWRHCHLILDGSYTGQYLAIGKGRNYS